MPINNTELCVKGCQESLIMKHNVGEKLEETHRKAVVRYKMFKAAVNRDHAFPLHFINNFEVFMENVHAE